MPDIDVRPLHLHTIESLCADLISGRPVGVGADNHEFDLSGDPPRAVLNWYRNNLRRWASGVRVADAEALVDAALSEPPLLTATGARTPAASNRRLTLTRIEAHRFGGLHAYGPVDHPPPTFVYEPNAPVTLFEGLNGSGKTSILNAIIWALTGQLLRPQRAPESGADEFECRLDGATKNEDPTEHRLSPVTPLPDPVIYRPNQSWVAADTWVELTFTDETGTPLPPIRRTQTRTARGKLNESTQNLSLLKVDPIALQTGTIMPGALPFIQVGSQSELGKAVAELTGLAALVNLAAHAGRAKRRIDVEFVKARLRDIEQADEAYARTHKDLIELLDKHPKITPADLPPLPSEDKKIEAALNKLAKHFERKKTNALREARTVLGDEFDADNTSARADLEKNIAPALVQVEQLGQLSSASRLAALNKLSPKEIANARRHIEIIMQEANTLATLATDPSLAARTRLYARIAAWVQEHPKMAPDDNLCPVCGSDLRGTVDPVTGRSVTQHLNEARKHDPNLLAQTMQRWADSALGALNRDLPRALQAEIGQELPDHPSGLIRDALIDELFGLQPFVGVLSTLKSGVAKTCDAQTATWPQLSTTAVGRLPTKFGDLSHLQTAINRLDRALRFASWRRAHSKELTALFTTVVGKPPKPGQSTVKNSLTGLLCSLDAIVRGATPINTALAACDRLQTDLKKRRAAEKRLAAYAKASAALTEIISIGSLAEQQVNQLRDHLHNRAATWRSRIYAGAFPSTAYDLVETGMTSKGHIELMVGARGVAAPAQHVANTSALRASLVGFFFAFWEYVLQQRGGLKLLLLDDPQELLDEENRERLAHAFSDLLESEAQLVITTSDRRFASLVADQTRTTNAIDHRSIHPVTPTRPLVQTAPAVMDVQRRQKAYEADIDDAVVAREYASECRIFIEMRLGDLFDDAAYPASSASNFSPTLVDHINRLRGLVNTPPSDLFRSPALRRLAADNALVDGAKTLALLNKAHHQYKHQIRPEEVADAADDLIRLRKAAEKAHEECRRWRRRDKVEVTSTNVIDLATIVRPPINVLVHPDLAAFTRSSAVGESQDVGSDFLDGTWFDDKSLFYLRCNNLGFTAPRGAVVIVEAIPSAVQDRRLVIARRDSNVFARRLLRSAESGVVALAAETADPRNSPQTLFFAETEVALHQIFGVLFDDRLVPPQAKTEAAAITRVRVLEQIQTAHRVREDSGVPLALPGQIVLGGPCIPLNEFSRYMDTLVALSLDDGSSIFKRVGASLPKPLAHLHQFESIGGFGKSEILSLGGPQDGLRQVIGARSVLGVLYHG